MSETALPICISVFHPQSNAKFVLKCADHNRLSGRNGLKRLLRAVVPKLNSVSNVSSAVLSYRDEEGDEISVRTDSDLKEAIRIASFRDIVLTISCNNDAQQGCDSDSSLLDSTCSSVDSALDIQFECVKVASDSASDPHSGPMQLPHTGPTEQHCFAETTSHVSVPGIACQDLSEIMQRISRVEQQLLQYRLQFREAVEDINYAHAQDRMQLNQASRECAISVDQVRHSVVDASSRLDIVQASLRELKSMSDSAQGSIAAYKSDFAQFYTSIHDMQDKFQQLQHVFDSHQQLSENDRRQHEQHQQYTEGLFSDFKAQFLLLQNQLDRFHQHDDRFSQMLGQHSFFQDKLLSLEQLQLQLKEQLQLHSQQLQKLQDDRADLIKIVDLKFDAVFERMTQLETHRESWTAIERLVSSGSSGCGSGNGNHAFRSNEKPSNSHFSGQDCGGSDEMCNSYVSLQLPLQIVSVSILVPSSAQPEIINLPLDSRSHHHLSNDTDFGVSSSAHFLQIVNLQVTFENVSDCIVPEDVEFRLLSQSKGVTKAAPSMHKTSRTSRPLKPKDMFTFTVCCIAPALASSFPACYVWQPYSAGLSVGSSLSVLLDSISPISKPSP